MNIKKIGLSIWNWLIRVQRILMIITATATVMFVFVPLILRELGGGVPAYEEFLITFAFWMYMLGSSHGSFEKSHITADIMSRILKGKPKYRLQLVASILTFILGIALAYWAFVLIQWSLGTGAKSSVYGIPIVIGQSSIFVGLILSSFYNLYYMIRDIRDNIKNRFPDESEKEGAV